MIQKLWHKKLMVLCLLSGCLLLIATMVSFPMYKEAAFDRMLQDEFRNELAETGLWPAMNEMVIISKKDNGGKAISRMETLLAEIYDRMGVTEKETISYYSIAKLEAESLMNRADVQDLSFRVSCLSGLPEHAKMLSGEMYSESGISEDGYIEVVISQACMVKTNLLVGETIECSSLRDSEGKALRLIVKGIYTQEDSQDFYWQITPDEMDIAVLMEEQLFKQYFTGDNAGRYTLTSSYYSLFEYENLKASQVSTVREYTDWLTKDSPYKSTMSTPLYSDILESFTGKQDRIKATLFILQVPVLILLCTFLFMLSGQMYEMERNEISVLKSRGGSRGQIIQLYLSQSILLSFFGVVGGLPLGGLFCRMLGATENFLEFNIRRELKISYTGEFWGYLLAAFLICVLAMTIPAWKHSRLTIVKLKQQKAVKKRAWWKKSFLDIICLGISMYGFYTYKSNEASLVQAVLMGKSLDPLLYLSASLFIIGMGLLCLRLQPTLINLIYQMGSRFWGPASYASFLENAKNGGEQQFIMLFMILTISLGSFHATVARTILWNAKENVEYLDGADVILKEVWEDNSAFASIDATVEFQYIEPDYSKYASAKDVTSYTKVIHDKKAIINTSDNKKQQISLMGIHTKEFGETTWVDEELLGKPYYSLLNELAVEAQGALVSRNFQTVLGYKAGDFVTCYNAKNKQVRLKIVDFVDYWPGYAPTSTSLNTDGTIQTTDNYIVVAQYATLQQKWGIVPYEVWMSVNESTQELKTWIGEKDLRLTKFMDRAADKKRVIEDPLLQGTNGVLTMGFVVTILLCGVGYLIYWVLFIRSREMLFGVLRASGMHKGEIFHMLMNEQIFSGFFSIIVGIVIGKVTSSLFVPILQTAYAATDQILPMKLVTDSMDMLRLYGVIGGVMLSCLGLLIVIVFRLNVVKALKLGEE